LSVLVLDMLLAVLLDTGSKEQDPLDKCLQHTPGNSNTNWDGDKRSRSSIGQCHQDGNRHQGLNHTFECVPDLCMAFW
jgi:hypothetical protein